MRNAWALPDVRATEELGAALGRHCPWGSQGPRWLFLSGELGSGKTTGNAVALTGFESAARLSYFLTGAPPDDALLATAAQGPLSADTIESEARRLLGSVPSRELVRHFYTQYLNLITLRDDPDLF